MTTRDITERVDRLRDHAEAAVRAQQAAAHLNLEYLADDADCPDIMRLAALAEELGEVARAVHDHDPANLRVELAQLAGIAIAWRSVL